MHKRTDLTQSRIIQVQADLTEKAQDHVNNILSLFSHEVRQPAVRLAPSVLPIQMVWVFASKDNELEMSDDQAQGWMYSIPEDVMQIRATFNQAIFEAPGHLSHAYLESIIEYACNVALSRAILLQEMPIFAQHLAYLSDRSVDMIEQSCTNGEIPAQQHEESWVIYPEDAKSYLKSIGY